ncbi:hypothetical protein GUJ93_ZPchr0006g43776 [Zizania palustris]|uniref:Uncharacterized protein n=1 Tax=Zizania palustris TaxID=103762 RepID=A0A8J5T869_ZIZPA|nr:hypothetical protein GUJ93_ZPchr0006g43776 [Zizania palustris]
MDGSGLFTPGVANRTGVVVAHRFLIDGVGTELPTSPPSPSPLFRNPHATAHRRRARRTEEEKSATLLVSVGYLPNIYTLHSLAPLPFLVPSSLHSLPARLRSTQ